jgi:3-deoxy-manno-octulosonate cytidylyltransferase (CMP-KDO synthetase)
MVAAKAQLRIVGVIPARLESTRLPRKALRTLCGRALVHQVYDRAAQCTLLTDLILATDSPEIEAYCREHNLKVMMTSSEHRSGTDRIQEVAMRTQADVFVNIQGDEPMITPTHIELLVEPFLASGAIQVTTLKTPISPEEAQDLSVNKVVTDAQGRALYFSHLPIPFRRDGVTGPPYYKHLGLYAYRKEVLEKFLTLPASRLEEAEKLEQLRLLENGIPIQVVETELDTIGVDTEEDFRKVEEYYSRS